MTRTAGAPIGCQRPSRFWGLGCPKIYHEAEDTLIGVSRVTLNNSLKRNGYPLNPVALDTVTTREGTT
ncbi:hypothetical protein [Thiolapillus sp.]|uniref:hypothetical protein n=1 Tax=Thiolapillus sp. TaxID=2017437 RepID=UPI003AF59AF0